MHASEMANPITIKGKTTRSDASHVLAQRLATLVRHHGLVRILERNQTRPRLLRRAAVWVRCHGCGEELDAHDRMSPHEIQDYWTQHRSAVTEDESLAFFSRWLDPHPWLCDACLLHLP